MRKRIHLHELRVGMYVEEIESAAAHGGRHHHPFFVNSSAEIQQLMKFNAMSAIINVRKGSDVDASGPGLASLQYENQLQRHYSRDEILRGKAALVNATPHVRQVLQSAVGEDTVDMQSASCAVDEIMSSTSRNAGALISLCKLKDNDEGTFLHCLAVSALLVTFGRTLDLSEGTVRLLGIAGLVHDIGKLAIPNRILTKAEKLSDEEFAVMRSHPRLGHDILSKISGMEAVILDVCLHHHEKYDGTGYPDGLSGETISAAARLAAICDVYDALTTIRPYKRAWSQAEATNLMLNSKGHFDPTFLKLFMSRMIVSGRLM